MEGVLLVARLLLAGVFAVAGAAKLADVGGTRRGIAGFGVPDRLAGPLSLAIPAAELAIAAALLPLPSAWFAALAALILLLVFLAAIVANLASGRRPDCRCFGRLRAAPIGASTVALNVGLLGIAGFYLWYGRSNPGIAAAVGQPTLAEMLAAAAIIAVAGLGVLLWRMRLQQERLSARLVELEARIAGKTADPLADGEGLPVGTKAPAFALPTLAGGTVTLDHLLAADKPTVLIFTDPDCAPCKDMLPRLACWQRDHAAAITIALLSEGTADENRTVGSHGLTHVLLQRKGEIADTYRCEGTPGAVVVRPDGTIGSPIAGGVDAIERLIVSLTTARPQSQRMGSTVFMLRADKSA